MQIHSMSTKQQRMKSNLRPSYQLSSALTHTAMQWEQLLN